MLVVSMLVGSVAAVAGAQEPTLTLEQVSAILSTTRNLSGKNLSGLNLAKMNFGRADLRRAKLAGSNLEGADLWRADLTEADLARARLAGANLKRADLSSANLTGADLSQADLTEATLRKAKLGGGARLTGANFTKAELFGSELREASAQGAVFKEAGLMLVDLGGADLTEANLEGAELTGASLSGSKLVRASLRRAKLARADFQGANVDRADLVGSDYGGARNLEKATNLQQAKLQETAATAAEVKEVKKDTAAGPVTARIYLRNGTTLDVESWTEQDETVLYTRAGATYGIPRVDVAKVEDAQGRPMALRPPVTGSDAIFRCRPPRLGDEESALMEFFRCTGAKPSYRTRMREGREMTVYGIPSASGGYGTQYFWVVNGRLVQIESAGSR